MMAVLRWELARRRLFMLGWTIGVSALIALTVLAYKALGSHIKDLDSSFSSLTSSAGSFFGGSDFFSPVGYLSSQIYYILLPLLLIIMVVTLVASLMHDEIDATIELTLARAITRKQLLCAKLFTALVVVGVVCVLSFLVALICVKIAGLDIAESHLLLTHVLTFVFASSFGMLSFTLLAVGRGTRRFAAGAAVVASFGGYIVSSMASYVSWLEQPAKFMPYHYFDTVALLNGDVATGLRVYLIAMFVVCAVIAVVGYGRRDIG